MPGSYRLIRAKISFPHDTNPFKHITAEQNSTRVKEQMHDLCFHLGQLTACYEETPPCLQNPIVSNFQEHFKQLPQQL